MCLPAMFVSYKHGMQTHIAIGQACGSMYNCYPFGKKTNFTLY